MGFISINGNYAWESNGEILDFLNLSIITGWVFKLRTIISKKCLKLKHGILRF